MSLCLSHFFRLSSMFEMSVHWKDFDFVTGVLSVCIPCAASSNSQSCVLKDLKFLSWVWYYRAPYGICVFQNGACIAFNAKRINSFRLSHLVEVNAFRMYFYFYLYLSSWFAGKCRRRYTLRSCQAITSSCSWNFHFVLNLELLSKTAKQRKVSMRD